MVDHAQAAGLPWDRAPLRGAKDLLDVQGPQYDGWLVGCKAISRRGNLADRMSEAMGQGRAAVKNLPEGWQDGVIPVQIMQRQGYETGRAYAVMEYDDFLQLVLERRKWRANQ